MFLNKTNTGTFDTIIVYILCGCLGAFSIPQFPIGVELGVETTFPVMEATSSGVLVIFGSLFMFIIPFVQNITESMKLFYAQSWKCKSVRKKSEFNQKDSVALDVTCGLSLVSVILSLVFLKPRSVILP